MKRALITLFCGCVLAFVLIWFLDIVKAHGEQRQERIQQERQERIDQSVNECKWAYPLDLISRGKCYEKLLG